nr:MAG: helix-turn-helix domain protein [Bacteriophage sp.]
MNVERFVENVRKYCALANTKPTVACENSGAGKNMLTNLSKRGIVPSVERVQMLAQYLGCTVSDLLGEDPAPPDPVREEFARLLDGMTAEQQNELFAFMLRQKREREN